MKGSLNLVANTCWNRQIFLKLWTIAELLYTYTYRVRGLKLMHFRLTIFRDWMTFMSKVNDFWDPEIGRYKTFNFHFIDLTWPPQPQKAKVPTFLWDVGVAPPWCCHTLVLSAPRSWVLRLSYEVLFVSVIGLVPSKSWKRLESGGYKVCFCFYWSKSQTENSLNFSDM